MKRVGVSLGLACFLFLVVASPALAAIGRVQWVNPPENTGMIMRTDDPADQTEYVYNIKAGHTVGGYVPKLGDCVEFLAEPGQTATQVRKIEPGSPQAPFCVE